MVLSITDLVPLCLLLMLPACPLLKDVPGCKEDDSIRQHHKQDDNEGAHVEFRLRCASWASRKGRAFPGLC